MLAVVFVRLDINVLGTALIGDLPGAFHNALIAGHAVPDRVLIHKTAIDALDNGTIAGAALDVFAEEPTKNERLYTHPKVSVTPHIGGSTKEAQGRIGEEIVDIITGFFK